MENFIRNACVVKIGKKLVKKLTSLLVANEK